MSFTLRTLWMMLSALVLTISALADPYAAYAREELEDPESAAVYYSELESRGRFSRLYDLMHPDAKRIIPKEVVVGWYENEFEPLGPGVVTVEDVDRGSWTWDVNGKTYRRAAEITYTQPFADGSVVRDTIHLVRRGGDWMWFWGPSREFVDDQIAIYADGESNSSNSSNPDKSESGNDDDQPGQATTSDYDIPLSCQEIANEWWSGTVAVYCDPWPSALDPNGSPCILTASNGTGGQFLCRSNRTGQDDAHPDQVIVRNSPETFYPISVTCEKVSSGFSEELICDVQNQGFGSRDCIEDPDRPSFGNTVYLLCR